MYKRQVLKDLEKEELENTMIRLEQQQITTHHLTRTISWIAIIACVLVVFFVVLIINDITQSQRYRRELEAAKTYTERLLHNREKLMLTVTHDIKSPLSSIIGYIEPVSYTHLIHSRDSLMEIFTVLKRQHYNMKGILHCCPGTEEDSRRAIDLGFLLGICGVVTFKKSSMAEVVGRIGAEHLVLETDAPYRCV